LFPRVIVSASHCSRESADGKNTQTLATEIFGVYMWKMTNRWWFNGVRQLEATGLVLCSIAALLILHTVAPADEPMRQVDDGFEIKASDWPWWRGPLRNGTAAAEQSPPTQFSESEGVLWQVNVPGRGHGSPTVFGERVFLATADEATGAQAVLCFHRQTGETLWNRTVHPRGGMWKNNKSTAASCTPACDGERIFVNFPNSDALITTALDLDGKPLWQARVSSYEVHQGYGASPALYRDTVIVTSDNKLGGAVTALNRTTGQVVWRRDRPKTPNYSSPILVHVDGRDQLILTGCDQVVSYDPISGEVLWETVGATTECVTSTVTDGKRIYTSGGYPKNHVAAVRADGSNAVEWESSSRLYVPSLLIRDGFLYGVLDEGIAFCWVAATGEERWKARLGGTFSASPVLVGEDIFVTNETGEFFVFKAQPESFQRVAKNQLGDQVFATPTIVTSQIFHRVALLGDSGERQEVLFCLSNDTN